LNARVAFDCKAQEGPPSHVGEKVIILRIRIQVGKPAVEA